MNKNMSKTKISAAAELLGVSVRTLHRWDKKNKLPAKRDKFSGFLYYDSEKIKLLATFFKIRRKEKAHLRKLSLINNEKEKFIRTTPLSETPARGFTLDDLKEIYAKDDKWKKELIKIRNEYKILPVNFKPQVDPLQQ